MDHDVETIISFGLLLLLFIVFAINSLSSFAGYSGSMRTNDPKTFKIVAGIFMLIFLFDGLWRVLTSRLLAKTPNGDAVKIPSATEIGVILFYTLLAVLFAGMAIWRIMVFTCGVRVNSKDIEKFPGKKFIITGYRGDSVIIKRRYNTAIDAAFGLTATIALSFLALLMVFMVTGDVIGALNIVLR
jgi:amino acid transporter